MRELEQRLPNLQSAVFPDYYTAITLFGCPGPMQQVAERLAPVFAPARDTATPGSPYLLVLQRQRQIAP